MKRRFITAALFSLSLCIAQAQKKPNIIIVNFDDLGYADTEPFGMTGVATPNFNRVAQQGMRLTHFLAAQPVCSASRASLLTGCYANRVGISGALMPESKVALNPKEETIASVLKKAGYKTAMLGKWHLGNQAPFFPTHYGFDSFLGFPYSNDMWPVGFDGRPITDPGNVRRTWPPLMLIEGDFPVDTIRTLEDQRMLTTLFTDRAVSYIKESAQSSFFLYLAHPMPHVPIAVSEKFNGKSGI
ncbi:MAG: sulfatase-like hydrolase/transferase, partial [Bacteroidales bacterium]|nr:sulfatase-like hydrolase/transferase [Bacteroidales bacterium]